MDKLQDLIARAEQAEAGPAVAARALALVDLTSLNDDDTEAGIAALCARAVTPAGAVAAVCVYPRFIATARQVLAGSPVGIATVVNFPGGAEAPDAVAAATAAAIAAGADEIDVVLPYQALLAGDEAAARAMLQACRDACDGAVMKVILETGALAEGSGGRDAIARASGIAIECGADFLKTSTGKVPAGASLEAAAIMLEAGLAAARPIGFKASGGVRTLRQAAGYLALADSIRGPDWATPATFRFGASGLLDALLAELGGPAAASTTGY
jgi:deoxyribose-phosphate aldolase